MVAALFGTSSGPLRAADVESIDDYFSFDPDREYDLRAVDALIPGGVPDLRRWLKAPDPSDSPGMRMAMLGYGAFRQARTQSSLGPEQRITG